jgi:hypothetical protein
VHGSLSETGKRLTRSFVGNIVREGNQSTIPTAISRGLHSGGQLSAAERGWGSDNNFIGFRDGQVLEDNDLRADKRGKSLGKSINNSDINAIVNIISGRIHHITFWDSSLNCPCHQWQYLIREKLFSAEHSAPFLSIVRSEFSFACFIFR